MEFMEIGYLVVRTLSFFVLALGRTPMLLPGTPKQRAALGPPVPDEYRRMRGRMEGRMSSPKVLLKAMIMWTLILAICVIFEVFMLIPMGEGVTFKSFCS